MSCITVDVRFRRYISRKFVFRTPYPDHLIRCSFIFYCWLARSPGITPLRTKPPPRQTPALLPK